MAGYGYGNFGGYGGGNFGGYGGGNIQQTYEQERVGYGPQGYGLYEQETQVNRNPYTGATTVVRENEFVPTGGVNYGGYAPGGYGAGGYGLGGGYGNRFY